MDRNPFRLYEGMHVNVGSEYLISIFSMYCVGFIHKEECTYFNTLNAVMAFLLFQFVMSMRNIFKDD